MAEKRENELIKALGDLPVFGKLVQVGQSLAEGIGKITAAFATTAGGLGEAATGTRTVTELKEIKYLIKYITLQLANMLAKIVAIENPINGPGLGFEIIKDRDSAVKDAAGDDQKRQSQPTSLLGKIGGFIGTALGVVTVFGEAIQAAISQVTKFVEALNPALMFQFNLALRDLYATFGVAFEPLMQVVVDITRQLGGVLLPAMQALAPIFSILSEIIGSLVLSTFEILATTVELTVDLFGGLIEALGIFILGVAELIRSVLIVIKTIIQTIAAAFGNADLRSILSNFRQMMIAASSAVLQFVVALALFFGQTGFVDRLIQNLSGSTGASAALQGVGINDFASIANRLATASAAASAGPGNTQEATLADVVSELQAIRQGMLGQLLDGFNGGLASLGSALNPVTWVQAGANAVGAVGSAVGAVGSAVGSTASGIARWAAGSDEILGA